METEFLFEKDGVFTYLTLTYGTLPDGGLQPVYFLTKIYEEDLLDLNILCYGNSTIH